MSVFSPYGMPVHPDNAYAGIFDDIRIYSREINSNEVWALYTEPIPNIASPTNIAASDGTYPDKVLISWSAVTAATAYEVWRNTANDSGSASALGETSGFSYDDTTATANTTYYYWVKAKSASETSAFSSADTGWRAAPTPSPTATFTPTATATPTATSTPVPTATPTATSASVPPAPSGVSASAGTYTDKIQVTWNPALGSSAYEIWRATVNNSASSTKLADVTAPADPYAQCSYADASVTVNVTYYYWIKAKNNVGASGFAGPASGYSQTSSSSVVAPTGVAASDGTYSDKVRVSWSAVSGATGYEVWRNAVNNSGLATKLADVSTTSYDDSTPTAGVTYYYWVKAKNFLGVSAFSASDTGYRTASVDVPGAPSGVTASDGTYTDKVRLNWNTVASVTGYEVWRNTLNQSGTATKLSDTTASTYDDATATAGTVYYYWVKSKNASASSVFSTPDTGYRQASAAAPGKPTGLTATAGNYTDKVRLSWSTVSEATSYEVWRNTANTVGSATLLAEVSTAAYDDTAAQPDTIYYYWVRAKAAGVPGDFSDPAMGYRVAETSADLTVPTGLSASEGTFMDKVHLTWTAVSGATSYEVWRNTSDNANGARKLSDAVTVSYDDMSSSPDTVYYYWVKAVNASGASAFSASDKGWRTSALSDLAAPELVMASNGSFTNKVRVSWSEVSGATGYEVWRSDANDTATASKLSDATGAGFDDIAALPGYRFYYWVKTKNADGTSAFSQGVCGYCALSSGSSGVAEIGLDTLVFLPRTIRPGVNPSTLSVRLTNNGPDGMGFPNMRVTFDLYLSVNSTFGDLDDTWIGEYPVDVTLAAGASQVVQWPESGLQKIKVPDFASGKYHVFAQVHHTAPSKLLDTNGNNDYVQRQGTITVGDALVTAQASPNDYDGDGISDYAVYQAGHGYWMVKYSSSDEGLNAQFGSTTADAVSGDYDGDKKADGVVYDETTGYWSMYLSGRQGVSSTFWGGPGYRSVRGDFDGDGCADIAIYHETSGNWYILGSKDGTQTFVTWGGLGYQPVSGDYDGDGMADLAVYQTASGWWFVKLSSSGQSAYIQFGGPGFDPVPGDYDGDAKADPAVYQPATWYWYARPSSGAYALVSVRFGADGCMAVVGDYDGDGKSDPTVYQQATGYWGSLLVGSGETIVNQFGAPGYLPVR